MANPSQWFCGYAYRRCFGAAVYLKDLSRGPARSLRGEKQGASRDVESLNIHGDVEMQITRIIMDGYFRLPSNLLTSAPGR